MSADSKAQLLTQIDDFRSEADALHATLTTLKDEDWNSSTTFKAWTIRDVMLHLHFGDRLGLLTLTDTQAYDQLRAEAEASTASSRTPPTSTTTTSTCAARSTGARPGTRPST